MHKPTSWLVNELEDDLEKAKAQHQETRRRIESLELLDPEGFDKIRPAMDEWLESVRRIDRIERMLDELRRILEHGLEDRTRYNSPAYLGL